MAQLCLKLYEFWENVNDAPSEVQYILTDLQVVGKILNDISQEEDLAPSVTVILDSCLRKLGVCLPYLVTCLTRLTRPQDFESLVREFDIGLSSARSKTERLITAIRFTGKAKQLQKLREVLSDAKQTLALGLIHQTHVSLHTQPF
jgi:hypothetical protein